MLISILCPDTQTRDIKYMDWKRFTPSLNYANQRQRFERVMVRYNTLRRMFFPTGIVLLSSWLNGTFHNLYVYRKTIHIAPIMDSELDVCDEFAVDSDECDLDADPSGRVSGCSSKG